MPGLVLGFPGVDSGFLGILGWAMSSRELLGWILGSRALLTWILLLGSILAPGDPGLDTGLPGPHGLDFHLKGHIGLPGSFLPTYLLTFSPVAS